MPRHVTSPSIPTSSFPVAQSEVSVSDARGEVDAIRGVRVLRTGRVGYEHLTFRPIAASIDDCLNGKGDYWDDDRQTWIRNWGSSYERDYADNVGIPYVSPPADEAPAYK